MNLVYSITYVTYNDDVCDVCDVDAHLTAYTYVLAGVGVLMTR